MIVNNMCENWLLMPLSIGLNVLRENIMEGEDKKSRMLYHSALQSRDGHQSSWQRCFRFVVSVFQDYLNGSILFRREEDRSCKV